MRPLWQNDSQPSRDNCYEASRTGVLATKLLDVKWVGIHPAWSPLAIQFETTRLSALMHVASLAHNRNRLPSRQSLVEGPEPFDQRLDVAVIASKRLPL